MNKKLFIFFAVAMLILAIALSACGSTPTTPTPAFTAPASDVDPSDANDEPFVYWSNSVINWVPFPVYDNLVSNPDPKIICFIWIGRVQFRGPILGAMENIYEVQQGDCYGEAHFTKKR